VERSGNSNENAWLSRTWLSVLLFSGPQIYALASAWIYNEPIFWAAAFASAFNYLCLKNYPDPKWPRGWTLIGLTTAAGLALLTRASTGIPLFAAAVLIVFQSGRAQFALRQGQLRQVVIAAAVCLAFLLSAMAVNYGRWGSPLAFSPPMTRQIAVMTDPHRLKVVTDQGPFQAERIPFAAIYYLTGLPIKKPFVAYIREHYDIVEGPRIPLLLVIPIPLIFASMGLWTLYSRRSSLGSLPIILVSAQALSALIVMAYLSLTLRYTMDFWGIIGALAAIGFHESMQRRFSRGWKIAIIALAIVGMSASLLTLLRYKISNDGVEPQLRLTLSREVRRFVCPQAPATGTVADNPPVITPTCPPMW